MYGGSTLKVCLPPSQPERDALELETRYTSVTHRTLEEVVWRTGPPALPKPTNRETRPDMVGQREERYETNVHAWQSIGPSFDRAAPRKAYYTSKPISYVSESKQTSYTPGYTGVIPLHSGELGCPEEPLLRKTEVRRDLPPATKVSRQANISGYAGYVRPGITKPAHHLQPCTTHTLTHRDIPVRSGRTGQSYPRKSPVSNLVSLTHPFNPYNKLNPAIAQRA